MSAARDYLSRLSRRPHRGTATAAEAAAGQEIRGWLAEMGYACETQTFYTPKDTLYLGPAAVLLLQAAALLLGSRWPWAGAALALLALVPLAGEMLGSIRIDLDLLLPLHRSQNVVARAVGGGEIRRRLIISAHYDTQRASLLFHPAIVRWLPAYFTLVYVLLAAAPALLLLRGAVGVAFPALAALCVALLANAAWLLLCRATGRYINGANDNGTGVALALALAEQFRRLPPQGTELLFLFTGAEEVGTRGMKAFLRQRRFDAATTRFINLDNIGGGKLHYLTGEGMLRFRPYSQELLTVAEELGRERPGYLGARRNLLLPTDGQVPANLGYQAISFLAFAADGSLPNYHWYTDTLERVDLALLDEAEEFLDAYARRVSGGRSIPMTSST